MILTLLLTFNLAVLWWVLGAILLSGIVMCPIFYIVAAQRVYVNTLRRGVENSWDRGHPAFLDDDSVSMYNIGMEWRNKYINCKKDVHVVNDGLNLYGEYYDLGHDRCVIILSGRSETLEYGYFFAIPYTSCGYNVLVVDPRAHGLSDGIYNTVGFEEGKDALVWAKYAHDELGVQSIVFHGICIGSAAAIYALTSDGCPDYIHGMVAEGMFANFGESMKEHLIERKKPVIGLINLIDFWMKHYTGHSMTFGPIDVIDKLDKPLLMLHSKEDAYSTPIFAQKLFDKAQTVNKTIVWFEHGKHSMLRITDTARYDGAIADFVANNF